MRTSPCTTRKVAFGLKGPMATNRDVPARRKPPAGTLRHATSSSLLRGLNSHGACALANSPRLGSSKGVSKWPQNRKCGSGRQKRPASAKRNAISGTRTPGMRRQCRKPLENLRGTHGTRLRPIPTAKDQAKPGRRMSPSPARDRIFRAAIWNRHDKFSQDQRGNERHAGVAW